MNLLRSVGLVFAFALVGCAAEDSTPGANVEESEDDVRAAATTLTIDLIADEYLGDGNWKQVPLASLNEQLAAKGLAPFDAKITLGRSEADKAKFEKLVERVAEASEKLGRELELEKHWDSSEYHGLCYTGLISGVRKTVDAQMGGLFSIYMGMPGYRFKSTKRFLYNGQTEAEFMTMHIEENGNEAQIAAWKQFDTSSDTFLMLSDGGQQGDSTELFAVSIPRCK